MVQSTVKLKRRWSINVNLLYIQECERCINEVGMVQGCARVHGLLNPGKYAECLSCPVRQRPDALQPAFLNLLVVGLHSGKAITAHLSATTHRACNCLETQMPQKFIVGGVTRGICRSVVVILFSLVGGIGKGLVTDYNASHATMISRLTVCIALQRCLG